MPKKWLLAPVCLFVSLSSACTSNANQGNDNPAFAPQVNPNPKYFMTVKGKIHFVFSRPMQLYLLPEYQVNNPNCNYTIDWFEGIIRPYTRTIKINIKPDAKGNYSVKIPLDYYLPGKCRWGIQNIQYFLNNTGYSPVYIAIFNPDTGQLPKDFNHTSKSSVICDSELNCQWQSSNQFDINLPPNYQYTFILNIQSS